MPDRLIDSDAPLLPLPGFRWLALLLVFVAGLTMWLLLYPFDFESPRRTTWLMERGISEIHKINLAENLVLFVPFGLLAGWVWSFMLPGRSGAIVLLVALDGAILSVVGETLQMWLPERTSSLNDLLANTLGAGAGGLLGAMLAATLTRQWTRAAAFLAQYRATQAALMILFIVLAARLAPFDFSLETYYLKTKFTQETKPAGGPFSATRRWLAADAGPLLPAAQAQRRALLTAEWKRAGSNGVLFLALAFSLVRAAAQWGQRGGGRWATGEANPQAANGAWHSRGGAAALVLVGAAGLVLITELLQGALRSRVMDTTDPVAGLLGVALGGAVGFLFFGRHRAQV